MKLGFVSAIVPELSLHETLSLAAEIGYDCVEVMCWPVSKAERRYAGVTHLDVTDFQSSQVAATKKLVADTGVEISALGYYPNPLAPDAAEAAKYSKHLEKLFDAAAALGLNRVNTFIGRDWTKSVADNWPRMLEVWRPLVARAAQANVKIGIENCPMFFTKDEWPGGKNLATSPAIWRKMFADLNSPAIGLNFDPSHFIWQHMDYVQPLREFADRLFHIHAKDARIDRDRLNDVGALACPNEYHTPKLPGLGEVNWSRFFSALTDTGYSGAVCVEVEDRAYEGSLSSRKAALTQSHDFLRQFVPKR